MRVICAVNVVHTQIEAVLMEVEVTELNYLIIVDCKVALDVIEVMVEVNERLFSDELKVMNQLAARIRQRMQSVLGISAKVTLVEPKTLARSEGKAVRVVDRRKLK